MTVDSYRFLPRLIQVVYDAYQPERLDPIPWTPLSIPARYAKFGLVTTGGLYHKGEQPPFDLDSERHNPTWGDPTFRQIPVDIQQNEIGVSHLHLNTAFIEQDFNVLLPLQRCAYLVRKNYIGGLADTHFSFMGYQGYPPDTNSWRETYAPQVARSLINQGVHCVLLTPG